MTSNGRGSQRQRLASLLGVSSRTLSRWDRAGTGPPKIKIGRKILYDLKKDFGMASKSRSPCNPCEHANLKRQLP
jgi:hypothetical protein